MSSKTKPSVGLALSGGGYRATLLHLGAMQRLQELGALERVTHISGVSGGAIAAAAYGRALTEQERMAGPSKKLSSRDYQAAFDEYYRIVLQGIQGNAFSRWAISFLLSPVIYLLSIFVPGPGWRAASLVAGWFKISFSRIYDQLFYKRLKLNELPTSVRVILNATSLVPVNTEDPEKERLFYFTRDYIGIAGDEAFEGPRAGKSSALQATDGKEVLLSEAVAASSALPGLIPPYTRKFEEQGKTGSNYYLADGGVYDNEGTFVLLDEWGSDWPLSRCDYILCSDGAGRDAGGSAPSFFASLLWKLVPRANTVLEMITIMKDHIRSQNFALLRNKAAIDRKKTGLKQYLAYHTRKPVWEDVNYRLPAKDAFWGKYRDHWDFPDVLQRVRTQIDAFDGIETRTLLYHGYSMMNSRLMRFCWKVLPEPKRKLYKKLRKGMFSAAELRKDPPPSIKWSQIEAEQDKQKIPLDERLPALKSWQAFNAELDERLKTFEQPLGGVEFGQVDFLPDNKAGFGIANQAYLHLKHSATSLAFLRRLDRFADRNWLAKILVWALKAVALLILVAIVVWLLVWLMESLLPFLQSLRAYIIAALQLVGLQ